MDRTSQFLKPAPLKTDVAVEMAAVHKWFGDFHVLRDINLEVARCSRLDLLTDWQGGWHPTFEVNDEQALIKRVHAEVGRYRVNGKINGYEIDMRSASPRSAGVSTTKPCRPLRRS